MVILPCAFYYYSRLERCVLQENETEHAIFPAALLGKLSLLFERRILFISI
jgi:hypothetical protein